MDIQQECKARSRMIADLDKAYKLALSVKNCTAAVRAKELIGKITGLFSDSTSKSNGYSFQDLNDAALEAFIATAQKELKD